MSENKIFVYLTALHLTCDSLDTSGNQAPFTLTITPTVISEKLFSLAITLLEEAEVQYIEISMLVVDTYQVLTTH